MALSYKDLIFEDYKDDDDIIIIEIRQQKIIYINYARYQKI